MPQKGMAMKDSHGAETAAGDPPMDIPGRGSHGSHDCAEEGRLEAPTGRADIENGGSGEVDYGKMLRERLPNYLLCLLSFTFSCFPFQWTVIIPATSHSLDYFDWQGENYLLPFTCFLVGQSLGCLVCGILYSKGYLTAKKLLLISAAACPIGYGTMAYAAGGMARGAGWGIGVITALCMVTGAFAGFTYSMSLTLNATNAPTKYKGVIMGVTQSLLSYGMGIFMFAAMPFKVANSSKAQVDAAGAAKGSAPEEIVNLPMFFIFIACAASVTSLLSAFFVHHYSVDKKEEGSGKGAVAQASSNTTGGTMLQEALSERYLLFLATFMVFKGCEKVYIGQLRTKQAECNDYCETNDYWQLPMEHIWLYSLVGGSLRVIMGITIDYLPKKFGPPFWAASCYFAILIAHIMLASSNGMWFYARYFTTLLHSFSSVNYLMVALCFLTPGYLSRQYFSLFWGLCSVAGSVASIGLSTLKGTDWGYKLTSGLLGGAFLGFCYIWMKYLWDPASNQGFGKKPATKTVEMVVEPIDFPYKADKPSERVDPDVVQRQSSGEM